MLSNFDFGIMCFEKNNTKVMMYLCHSFITGVTWCPFLLLVVLVGDLVNCHLIWVGSPGFLPTIVTIIPFVINIFGKILFKYVQISYFFSNYHLQDLASIRLFIPYYNYHNTICLIMILYLPHSLYIHCDSSVRKSCPFFIHPWCIYLLWTCR